MARNDTGRFHRTISKQIVQSSGFRRGNYTGRIGALQARQIVRLACRHLGRFLIVRSIRPVPFCSRDSEHP